MNARPSGISFLGAPLALEPTAARADLPFLGIPYGDPHDMRNLCPPAAEAPDAVRSASAEFAADLGNHDFDLGGPVFPDPPVRLVDCGDGPGDPRDLEDARASGNIPVAADEVHARGAKWLADLFPAGEHVYITIDIDGLDPSCAPGTLWPSPGGLTFTQVAALVRTLAGNGELAGTDICEFAPSRDLQGHTACVITRLLMNAMGVAARRQAR